MNFVYWFHTSTANPSEFCILILYALRLLCFVPAKLFVDLQVSEIKLDVFIKKNLPCVFRSTIKLKLQIQLEVKLIKSGH